MNVDRDAEEEEEADRGSWEIFYISPLGRAGAVAFRSLHTIVPHIGAFFTYRHANLKNQ
jgi:hypothetical protein